MSVKGKAAKAIKKMLKQNIRCGVTEKKVILQERFTR